MFVGNFRDAKKHGPGTVQYRDGSEFKGQFEDDKRSDRNGQFKFSNGDVFTGVFVFDNFVTGKVSYADGGSYTGGFIDGVRNGEGTWSGKNGEKYEGKWEAGLKDGYGKYIYSNGEIFRGIWKNDLKDGIGELIKRGKPNVKGLWKGEAIIKDFEGVALFGSEIM